MRAPHTLGTGKGRPAVRRMGRAMIWEASIEMEERNAEGKGVRLTCSFGKCAHLLIWPSMARDRSPSSMYLEAAIMKVEAEELAAAAR